jgi:hypothetical protein
MLDYVVCGTGRCGTVYMARLLTSLGIGCLHEGIFGPEGLDDAVKIMTGRKITSSSYCSNFDMLTGRPLEKWIKGRIRAESSFMAAPFLDDPILNGTKIIHLVRNPLQVISSFHLDMQFFEFDNEPFRPWRTFVFTYLPELETIACGLERTCYYYIAWNQMIEEKAKYKPYLIHQVENQCNKELLEFTKTSQNDDTYSKTETNSWRLRQKDLTLDQIPNGAIKEQLVELASRYNYQLE